MAAIQLGVADLASLRAEINRDFTPQTFTVFLLDKCGGRSFVNYVSAANWIYQVTEAVQKIGQEGWLGQFVLAAADERTHNAKLQELAQKVRNQVDAELRLSNIPPYEAIWLPKSRAMINRSDLRSCAEDMWTRDVGRVLVIRGKSKTGRSHSLYFIQHLAERFNFEAVDLNLIHIAGTENECNAYQLAVNLNQRLNLGFPFTGDDENKQAAFKVEPFVQRFLSVLGKPEAGQYVLIFDGFGHVEPAESGLQLIHRLAGAAGVSLNNLRVVLLGFDEDLAMHVEDEPLADETSDFTIDHIAFFFDRFYKEVLGRPAKEEELKSKVLEAFQAGTSGMSNVAAVGRKATDICRRLIQS